MDIDNIDRFDSVRGGAQVKTIVLFFAHAGVLLQALIKPSQLTERVRRAAELSLKRSEK